MKLSIVLLCCATACWGQQAEGHGCLSSEHCFDKAPAPLKCGKYQHVEAVQSLCPCDKNGCTCLPPTAKCAPDLHTVTEKEWQELNEQLRLMQKLLGITVKPLESKEGR
jgi:hypothetical protein